MTFEPLLMRDEESTLREYSVVAIASVTQVLFLTMTPKIERLSALSLKVDTTCIYSNYIMYIYIYVS